MKTRRNQKIFKCTLITIRYKKVFKLKMAINVSLVAEYSLLPFEESEYSVNICDIHLTPVNYHNIQQYSVDNRF